MRNRGPRLGSILLLFTVAMLCVAVLAVLSLETARADLTVAKRGAQTVQQVYKMEQMGQEWLAQACGALSGAEQADSASEIWHNGKASAQLETENRVLHIELAVQTDGTVRIERWENLPRWQQDTAIGNLWDGNVQKEE